MSEIKTNKISSLDSSNSDITLDPDGTGKVAIPAAVEVDSNDITVAFDGADDVNSLILQGSNGSSEKYTFELQADGGGSAAKFMIGSGGGAASEKMRLTSEGQLFLGHTSAIAVERIGLSYPDSRRGIVLKNITSTNGSDAMLFANTNGTVGTINTNGSSTSYNTSSDHRLKENAVDMTGAITRVKSLQPKRFNFIADDSVTVDGFMAHEAQTVVPEAVTGTHNEVDDDGNAVYQGIDQSKLVPLLTAALKESITKIEALETENSTQATQIADLITRVTALENA